jgi:hypothetical protein
MFVDNYLIKTFFQTYEMSINNSTKKKTLRDIIEEVEAKHLKENALLRKDMDNMMQDMIYLRNRLIN